MAASYKLLAASIVNLVLLLMQSLCLDLIFRANLLLEKERLDTNRTLFFHIRN